VSLIQFFGSALQVTPHFHSRVPDGVFVPGEGGMRFEALPPLRTVALLPAPLVALGTFVLLPLPRHLERLGWSFAAAGLATAVLLGIGLA
jgi:hypothetical protein